MMGRDQFRLQTRHTGTVAVITVTGELDLASSPTLQTELDRVESRVGDPVIIDLSNLEFMDSTGLSVVVRAHQRAQRDGRRFALVKGSAQVQQLFALTGIAQRITLADTLPDLLGD
jgi:anti-anti-sigma factor